MDATDTRNRPAEPLLDIPALLGILWYRKFIIAGCVTLMVFLALVYSTVTPASYTAQAVILLDPRESVTINSTNVLSGIGSDSAAIASQVSVVRSPELLRKVFEAENLANDPEFSRSGLISSMLSLVRGSIPTKTEAAIFESFRGRVDVDREGLTYILNVGFVSSDPVKAARIVNAIVAQYRSGQIAEKSGASTEVTGLLNDRIDELREEVTKAEQAIEAFRSENNIFDVGAGRTLLDTQVEQLNTQWVGAQDAVRAATNRYEQARTIGTSPEGLSRLTDILSSPAATELRNTYNLRLSALANSQATLGNRHPTRVALEAEVERLTALMRAEAERIIAELRATKELAEASVIRIETDLAMLRNESSLSNQQSVELRQLERNADASRQVLEQFLARSEETTQLQQLQKSDARIISNATPPISATWPKRSLLVAVAGMLGLMMGGALALLLGSPENKKKRQKPKAKRKKAKSADQANRKRSKPKQKYRTPAPVGVIEKPDIALGNNAVRSRYPSMPFDNLSEREADNFKLEVADYPQDPFAQDISKLTGRLTQATGQYDPSIFVFSSNTDHLSALRVAYAVALNMQAQGDIPLIVDLAPTRQSAATDLDDVLDGYIDADSSNIIDDVSGLAVLADYEGMDNGQEKALDTIPVLREILGDRFDALIIVSGTLRHKSNTNLAQNLDKEVIVLGESTQRSLNKTMKRRISALGDKAEVVTLQHDAGGVGTTTPRSAIYVANENTYDEASAFEQDYDEEDVGDAVAELRRVVRHAGQR